MQPFDLPTTLFSTNMFQMYQSNVNLSKYMNISDYASYMQMFYIFVAYFLIRERQKSFFYKLTLKLNTLLKYNYIFTGPTFGLSLVGDFNLGGI